MQGVCTPLPVRCCERSTIYTPTTPTTTASTTLCTETLTIVTTNAGPDHLAALLPRCCGQRWYRAGRVGALWGMGHGVSATLLGVTAFFLKSRMANMSSLQSILTRASSVTEIAVGLSLVIIGLMGIKEAREWESEIDGVQPQSLSAAAADVGIKSVQKRAVMFNGLLHGFSWDGAPSLAPALAVADRKSHV